MSDVIGRGILETVVDNSQLQAGMAAATESVKKFEQAADQAGQKAGAGLAKSADGANVAAEATGKLDAVTKRFMTSMEREIATLSLSRSEFRQWEAQTKNIAESAYAPLIARLSEAQRLREQEVNSLKQVADAQREMTRAQAEAASVAARAAASRDSFVAGLKEQVATFGKSAEELLRYKAAQVGAGQEARDLITKLTALNAAQDAAANSARALADAERDAARAKSEMAAANARAASVRDSFVAGLRDQIALFNKTTEETLRYRAAQAGAAAEASPLITQLNNMKAAHEANARAAREDAEAQRLAANIQSGNLAFVKGLEQQANAIGKTRAQLLELEAAQRGVSTQAAPFIAQLKRAEDQLRGVGGVSRATAAALRNVPAQFTDIVVSLQAGQSPFTVFLQQGGQLKDMFGSAGEAARVMGRYVLGVITPLTLLGAAFATLGVAYYQGSRESTAFQKSIVLTGNYAGVTTNQLGVMARGFRDIGISQGAASEALAMLVGSGKVASTSLNVVAEAAINLSKVTGTDLKTAIEEFIRLGEDPAKAAAKLNEQYHFLTQAVYEQIKALEEQGRKEEAAALAQTTYANAMNRRTAEIKENLGTLESAWAGVTKWAKLAWDAMLDVGRDKSFAQKYTDQMDIVYGLQKQAQSTQGTRFGAVATARLQEESAKLEAMARQYNQSTADAAKSAQRARDEQSAISATDTVQKWQERAKGVSAVTRELEDYRKRIEAIRKVNPDSAMLDPKAIAAGEAAIRKSFQGSSARPKQFRDDEATKYLLTLRQTEAQLQEQLDIDEKLTGAARERAKFEQLIADLKVKGTLTADQKSLLANEAAIRSQLQKNEAIEAEVEWRKSATKEAVKLAAAEARAYENFVKRQESINLSMVSKQDDRSGGYERALDAVGLGDRARQQVEAQKAIYSEFKRYQLELDKSTPADLMGGEEYLEQVERIKVGLSDALQAQKNFYSEEEKMRLDWSYGATRAFANYIDGIKDVAAQTEQIFGNAFKSLEETIFNFSKTGKLNIKSLFGTITDDLLKSGIRTGITGPVAELLQGQMASGEGVGGGIGSYLSTLFGGGGAAFKPRGGNGALAGSASGASSALQSLTEAANNAALALGGQRSMMPAMGAGSSMWGQIGKGLSQGNWSGLFNSALGSSGQAAFSQTALGSSGFGTGLAYGNMDFGGFLANGGPANRGRAYRILENGPEMLTMQNGKSMLMMTGNQSGRVTPVTQGAPEPVQPVTQIFYLNEPASHRTQVQVADSAARGLMRGRRNS